MASPTSPDILIVGGGAAGLAAAIFAAEAGAAVTLLDGARSLGAKILVSGGGRCNVTHAVVRPEDFNGSRNIVRNVLAAFDEAATVRWFEALGVTLKREETGKLFPTTDSARTVLQALLRRCEMLGVTILTGHRVTDIAADIGGGFTVHHALGAHRAGRLILATGGRSLPKTGSDGGGWEMVRRLGHTVTDTHPALVPLVLEPSYFHAAVSGLSHEAELTTLAEGGKVIDRRRGSLLWTHFGISGPLVMDASRHWVIARAAGRGAALRLSFLPGQSFEEVERRLVRLAADRPRITLGTALAGDLPQRLADAVLAHLSLDRLLAVGQLSREHRRRLVHALTGLALPVERDRGWNYAEVTAGGVPLGEIDYRTMGSRRVAGLYLIGEILDCDGRIGGFNFQWAWSTAHVAGRAAARGGEAA